MSINNSDPSSSWNRIVKSKIIWNHIKQYLQSKRSFINQDISCRPFHYHTYNDVRNPIWMIENGYLTLLVDKITNGRLAEIPVSISTLETLCKFIKPSQLQHFIFIHSKYHQLFHQSSSIIKMAASNQSSIFIDYILKNNNTISQEKHHYLNNNNNNNNNNNDNNSINMARWGKSTLMTSVMSRSVECVAYQLERLERVWIKKEFDLLYLDDIDNLVIRSLFTKLTFEDNYLVNGISFREMLDNSYKINELLIQFIIKMDSHLIKQNQRLIIEWSSKVDIGNFTWVFSNNKPTQIKWLIERLGWDQNYTSLKHHSFKLIPIILTWDKSIITNSELEIIDFIH